MSYEEETFFFDFATEATAHRNCAFFDISTPMSSYHCSDFSHPQRLSALDHTAQLECHICDPIFYCCCSRSGIILARLFIILLNVLWLCSVCYILYLSFDVMLKNAKKKNFSNHLKNGESYANICKTSYAIHLTQM